MEAPTGLARRNRRRSDQETRERMLRAATDMISRTGLTVSLDHISFEDVIRDADVSRSSAYRHWPYKDLFFRDLVKELARTATPGIVSDEIDLMKRVLAEHQDWLETPESRHRLLLELIRQLAVLDLRSVLASPRWRTYLALHAAFSSLADGELREQVRAALSEAESAHTAKVAKAWQQMAGMFGYRLRPELPASFEALATLLNASLRGLVIMALSDPAIATDSTLGSPFGSIGTAEWSLAAIAGASIATAFLEPDPATEWDDQRLADLHRILDAWRDE